MKKSKIEKDKLKVAAYTGFATEKQLNNYKLGKMKDSKNEKGLQYNIDLQISRLKEYCKKNNIDNIVEYVDIGMGANSNDRPALRKMIADIDKGIINKIIVTSPDRLFRDLQKMYEFADKCFSKDIEVISLDTEHITDILFFSEEIENAIRKERENMENDMEY